MNMCTYIISGSLQKQTLIFMAADSALPTTAGMKKHVMERVQVHAYM